MRRIPELDAIRGLAALVIVAYHLWFINVPALGTAVDLFFVLSGYLITTILLRDAGRGPGLVASFYARRALRIWPIYYLSLLALVVLNRWLPNPGPMAGLPYDLTYTQKLPLSWFGTEPPLLPAFQHTWTLAIEEQFYLIWPALVLILNGRRLAPTCLAIAGLSFVARGLGWSPWLLMARADGLALGSLLAAVLRSRSESDRKAPIAFGLIVLTATSMLVAWKVVSRGGWSGDWSRSLELLLMNVAYTGAVGLIVCRAGRPALAGLRIAPLCYLGRISYGLYLYHHMVLSAAEGLGFGSWFGLGFVELAASLALAVVSWEFLEKPILAWKLRFAARLTSSAEPVVVGAPG